MVFREDGHISDGALTALARNEDRFDELERLEIAEHLAFCDYCLQRYTMALEDGALLAPERSCQRTLWMKIRSRALRMITSRYATAAAAVTLALTVLWGGERVEFTRPVFPEDRPSVSRQLTDWTGGIGDSLRGAVGGISDFFDGLSARRMTEGGNRA
ncbi:hypothetical protein [uncultured Oscillibacter sp.]|uniref:hypothetical protein n=1 Tax=uncultured Oscillibacter sp. TaxID=876091 RepID=UPI0026118F75|nr:hypothetical protein [uncultured Oscillibacter sp.]